MDITSPAAMRLMTASSNRRIGFGSGWLSIVGSAFMDCVLSIPYVTRATVLERRGRGTLTRRDAARGSGPVTPATPGSREPSKCAMLRNYKVMILPWSQSKGRRVTAVIRHVHALVAALPRPLFWVSTSKFCIQIIKNSTYA